MKLDAMVKHEPVSLDWETFDAMRSVIQAAEAIGDSFTRSRDGAFIHDDLTESEWRPLRDALDRLAFREEDADGHS